MKMVGRIQAMKRVGRIRAMKRVGRIQATKRMVSIYGLSPVDVQHALRQQHVCCLLCDKIA